MNYWDPNIQYYGMWRHPLPQKSINFMISISESASAVISFNGTAVCYGNLFEPIAVAAGNDTWVMFASGVSLDGGPLQELRMIASYEAPIGGPSKIRWCANGLTNGPHTLTVTPSDRHTMVDEIIYTVEEGISSSSASSIATSTSAPSTSNSCPNNANVIAAIAAPASIACLALLVLAGFMMRRKREHVSGRTVGRGDWVEREDPTVIPLQYLNTLPLNQRSGNSENDSMTRSDIPATHAPLLVEDTNTPGLTPRQHTRQNPALSTTGLIMATQDGLTGGNTSTTGTSSSNSEATMSRTVLSTPRNSIECKDVDKD